jgi:hypothetical protein
MVVVGKLLGGLERVFIDSLARWVRRVLNKARCDPAARQV